MLYKPSPIFKGICAKLRSTIKTAMRLYKVKPIFTTQLNINNKNYKYSQHFQHFAAFRSISNYTIGYKPAIGSYIYIFINIFLFLDTRVHIVYYIIF